MMEKHKLLYWIDIGLLILGGSVMITGVSKLFDLMHSRLLNTIHDWSGFLFTILAVVHIVLHFNWLKYHTIQLFRGKKLE